MKHFSVWIKIILMIFLYSAARADDMYGAYKSLMRGEVQAESKHMQKQPGEITKNQGASREVSRDLSEEIQSISKLKQGTFESTGDFNKRRNDKIMELDNRIVFLAQEGAEDYSAGTVTMKNYDADNEIMTLNLSWNEKLESVLPDIKEVRTATLHIPRDEAKKLFEKKKTHYFHIGISYDGPNLIISKMKLYGRYQLKAEKRREMPKPATPLPIKPFSPVPLPEKNFIATHIRKPPPRNYQKYRVTNVASNDTLNVRTDPYVTRNNKVGELSYNARNINKLYCKRNYKGTKWCMIEYHDYGYPLKGWVVARCLMPQNGSSVRRSTQGRGYYRVVKIRSDDTLAVRNGPGTEYYHIGDLPYNARAVQLGRCRYSGKGGKWCVARYGGIEGWVSAKYLRRQ